MKWHYTTIQFECLRDLDLSAIEYIVSDLTYHQSKGGDEWWPYSPTGIGELMGVSEKTIRDVVERCVEKGTIAKEGRDITSCDKFISMVYPRNGRNFHLTGRNFRSQTEETSALYNYISKENNNSESTIRVEKVYESEEEKPKKVSRAKYPNFKTVFALWPSVPKSWDNNTQKQAAENLYQERGLEAIRDAIEWYETVKDIKFCPTMRSPHDLDIKWDKLDDFSNQKHD